MKKNYAKSRRRRRLKLHRLMSIGAFRTYQTTSAVLIDPDEPIKMYWPEGAGKG